jgi:diguanylate cyclase (GGDEF)-like protein
MATADQESAKATPGPTESVGTQPIRERLTHQLSQVTDGLQSTGVLASVAVAVLLWEHVPLVALALWLMGRLSVEVLTAAVARAYSRAAASRLDSRTWMRRFSMIHVADAISWGSWALFLLWPLPELLKILLSVLILSYSVILLTPMSAFHRLYSLVLAIMIAPTAAMLIAVPPHTAVSTVAGLVCLSLWAYLCRTGRRTHRARVQALRTELSNSGLSRQLRVERGKRRQIQQRLLTITDFDAVTGLPNQWQFSQRAQRLLDAPASQGERACVAIVLINIRGFTQVNAGFGRPAGDYLLAQVGGRLQALLPATATASRLGNDEFAAAVRLSGAPDAGEILVKSILSTIEHEVQWEDNLIEVATAVGYCLAPEDGTDIDTLIKKADVALREAKVAPGGRCVRFNPAMEARVANRFALQHALRRALANQELALHYQPLVDLNSGRVIGAEALLRWTHPDYGEVSPVDFIPLAEQSGQISEIGAWVLREACRQASVWQLPWAGRFSISVNVSVQQLADRSFPRQVEQALRESGLPPAALRLEITETVVMVNPDAVLPLLDGIRRAGVRIALDDFGTGYSSLSYLTQMNLDYLKLDKSFIRDICTVERSATIVNSVISLAGALGLKVIAEGIESVADWRRLLAKGCPYGQGFHFSRPLPAAEFERLPRVYQLPPAPRRTAPG